MLVARSATAFLRGTMMIQHRTFALLSVAMEVCDQLRPMLLRAEQDYARHAKGARDLVTDIDLMVEKAARTLLKIHTPDIPLLGEESGGPSTDAELFWVIDPIDGTVNFSRRNPLFGLSLALVHRGRPVVGCIDLPAFGERYYASEGNGAFRDGKHLHLQPVEELQQAIVCFGDFAFSDEADALNRQRLAMLERLSREVLRIRMYGTAVVDLTGLVNGHCDAVVLHGNLPWDVMAGVLLAREAGAVVFDQRGEEHGLDSTCTYATSPGLKRDLLQCLHPAAPEHLQAGDDSEVGC